MLACRLSARTPIGQIVGVGAVHDRREAALARHGNELGPELRLAEVAAIARIRGVPRVLELGGVQLEDRHVERARDLPGGRPLRRGVRRASADDREDAIALERHARRDGEIRRIDATAEADRDRCPLFEPCSQRGFSPIERRVRRSSGVALHRRRKLADGASPRQGPSRAATAPRAKRLTRQPMRHSLREPIEDRGDLPPIAATLKNELKRERARRPHARAFFVCRTSPHCSRLDEALIPDADHRRLPPPRPRLLRGRTRVRV